MNTKKQLWILVGGNGAGKSTFYKNYLEPLGLPFVNADILARIVYPDAPEEHSYDAAKLAEQMRRELLLSGASFCFETVYSHPSKIDFVAHAKALGYEVIMVVIHLQFAELNQARVAERVSEGGHSVPDEKVSSRIPRTLQHVKTSISLCDRVQVYDNSFEDNPFKPVFSVRNGTVERHSNPLPDWAEELLSDFK
ncbi:MAG: AAA family ATPase [Gammaproteobacteria bacterium]|nr:AAA family ATPase [Gammaproteobacteria bacterium]MBU1655245.1 AAA family ATPase [Gammaproteobacteria bacterium]MBU1959750.1 AAA family ATPase [Gammaproteobacteria bacterium]